MLQNLPQDPVILLSVINTKLRDFYPSLDQLCKEMEVNKKELTDKDKNSLINRKSANYR